MKDPLFSLNVVSFPDSSSNHFNKLNNVKLNWDQGFFFGGGGGGKVEPGALWVGGG